ncbi:hypothetical protein JI739_02150 [Ramlibacter sp. AW1]|uniref:Sodium:proline symporter n=1 Tax=Ramlibacter aurantiacus TaxID=2801330 RepID=A0A936ZKY6_9BURK|nr:hypothetical protein [Ramlibacter aurantiacus]MBL0419140.1 hypothetical protein [Ramlibacter aurantiacus]
MASPHDTIETAPGGHRGPDYRGGIRWGAAAWAGIAAGIVFLMMEMLLVWLALGQSPWGPPRMIAALVMGKEVLPPPASFSAPIVMTAMVIHLVLSVVYGLILGAIVHRMGKGAALVTGAVFGLVVYLANFHLIAPMAFPWFTQAQNWVSVLSHVVFGAVIAAVYAGSRDRRG